MAALVFIFTFPACIGLVILALLFAALLPLRMAPLVMIPIALLVLVNLYLLPEMYHPHEVLALAVQSAVSALSLFAFLILKYRRRRAANTPQPSDE